MGRRPHAHATTVRFVLHLRVITPTELRDSVIDALTGNPGVTHLVVHRDGALDPPGDEITADIARESANQVIDALKALGVKERGAITLDVVDTVLSTRAYRAEERAAGDPADAVVWDELAARTREESTLNVTYMMFLCLACLIAAVGRGNRLTRHGGRRDGGRARIRAAGSAGGGAGTAQDLPRPSRCAGASDRLPVRHADHRDRRARRGGTSAGSRSTSTRELEEVDFIFQVGPLSFVVALFAGAAGMLSLVSAKSAALVGVFISVTTVPAAGFAVVAATVGDWDIAAKSAAQLAINLSGIVLAGVLVLWVRGIADRRQWHMAG